MFTYFVLCDFGAAGLVLKIIIFSTKFGYEYCNVQK